MAQTSLSRLQNLIIKLEKENVKLRDLLNERKEKQENAENQLYYYKKNIETIVKNAVNKAVEQLINENQQLKLENQRLKSILNNSSENSGLPTSKTPIDKEKRVPNSRIKSEKSKGGQVGHKKNKLERFKENEITDTCIHEVVRCTCGCEKLKDLGVRTTKDLFDVNIRLMKIRNEFHTYKCARCGKIIESPVPLNLKEENQYGENVQALALSLVNEGYVSYHRTKELISGFTGGELTMSEGYIVKLQKRCYDKLSNFDNEIKKSLLKEKVINWDDTVINIDKKQGCLRFYGTNEIAFYVAHEKKNKEGLDEDGILKNLSKDTVVVHDHNKVNYNDEYEFTNAECCVHLIRDLKKVQENLNHNWTNQLINLLIETNNKRKEYINSSIMYFDQEVSDKVSIEYDKIILQAKEENRKDFSKYYGNEEKTLIKRLIDYKENYLLWVLRFDVPFSNNLSERSLRSSKTKMKVSGQFSNLKNAEYFARIKTYIETCKRNNKNVHEALVKLISDNPYTVDELLNN